MLPSCSFYFFSPCICMDDTEREAMKLELKRLEDYLKNFHPETPEDEDKLKQIRDKIHIMKWALYGRY